MTPMEPLVVGAVLAMLAVGAMDLLLTARRAMPAEIADEEAEDASTPAGPGPDVA